MCHTTEFRIGYATSIFPCKQDSDPETMTVETGKKNAMIESIIKKLFFRSSGKPKRIVRKVLFRRSLKPHRIFHPLVLTREKMPNRYFEKWMGSEEFHAAIESRKSKSIQMRSNSSSTIEDLKVGSFRKRSKARERLLIENSRQIAEITQKLNETSLKLDMVSVSLTASLEGLQEWSKRHERSLNAIHAIPEIKSLNLNPHRQSDIDEALKRIEWIEVDNNNIRERLEFVRKEVMFELRKNLKIVSPIESVQPENTFKLVNPTALSGEIKKVNLGCGHIPKKGYINVDARELPGVDLVANVSSLPFESGSLVEIYASHLIEHFSDRALKDIIFPHWKDILEPKGKLVLIAPNIDEMIKQYNNGATSFENFREIVFGGQEYDGDFHFTMISPPALEKTLLSIGFSDVKVVENNRVNGGCIELEVHATK